DPEVRQITVPCQGARLIMASDGLWDAVNFKTVIHKLRGMTAGVAAPTAVHMAMSHKGLADDVTVLIVDFLADSSEKLPHPLVASAQARGKGASSGGTSVAAAAAVVGQLERLNVWRPLEAPSNSWRERLASRRQAMHTRLAAKRKAEQQAAEAAAAEEAQAAELAASAAPSGNRAGRGPSAALTADLDFRVDLDQLDRWV
ncbi:hypothetical protein QJQ45_017233, partial [Haematococcus lacustris]